MVSLCESRFLNHTLTLDDISKNPQCNNIKFKRAFQFLQLLLIQRVYGIDFTTLSGGRRPNKCSQQEHEQQQHDYQVFLGGSCNPTTWRRDQAIPYFRSLSVSFYNPQVTDWTPDLVAIEHRAKELAPLLFFVIDHDTRALASIVEVCYLAARGRRIIVVMSPMSDKKHTKFIQQKDNSHDKDDEDDYQNACEARQTLHTLLRNINIPVFDNLKIALECAALTLEATKRTIGNHSTFRKENKAENSEQNLHSPLSNDCQNSKISSVVLSRSLSDKTTFKSPDDFFRKMLPPDSSSISAGHSHNYLTLESIRNQLRQFVSYTKTQLSSSTNESDDDGYGSLQSGDHSPFTSSTSLNSQLFEPITNQQHEKTSPRSDDKTSTNKLMSTFYPYLSSVTSLTSYSSLMSHSLFSILTLPARFIRNTLHFTNSSLSSRETFSSLQETNLLNRSHHISSFRSPNPIFDVYIASGESDENWLNAFVFPKLKEINITFTQRQSHRDNDQYDSPDDMHVIQRSHVLYYLINGVERLSHLTSELAFLIGERKHKIVLYLQTIIDKSTQDLLSESEQRDIQRSRKYLEDLAQKENIKLSYSRAESLQHVLNYFHQDD